MRQKSILLVQLASMGDCLFVTTIAKQIKVVDYPGCHLTWMIAEKYKSVIQFNPYIDNVVEIPAKSIEDFHYYRKQIPSLVALEKTKNKYDYIFITDYTPKNYINWFGTIRSSLFRSYPHSLKIIPQPLIYLSDEEVLQVRRFCDKYKITSDTYNILFECSPQSQQSPINFDIAKEIALEISNEIQNCRVILSSAHPFQSDNECIIDGSEISWRCNAELANYCHLLIGCSSGISWLLTSNWCKRLPTIQIINCDWFESGISVSMKTDFHFFNMATDHIIEMHHIENAAIKNCVALIANGDLQIAKSMYDSKLDTVYKFKLSSAEKLIIQLKFNWFYSLYALYISRKPKWFKPVDWVKRIIPENTK